MSATCGSCSAPIIWARTEKGRSIPVDERPVLNGNLDLVPDADPREPPTAFVLDKQGFRAGPGGTTQSPFLRYQSHFASCPDAAAHRKTR